MADPWLAVGYAAYGAHRRLFQSIWVVDRGSDRLNQPLCVFTQEPSVGHGRHDNPVCPAVADAAPPRGRFVTRRTGAGTSFDGVFGVAWS
jgi:hypothetical protein